MKKAMNKKVETLSLSTLASALFFAHHGHAAMPMAGQMIQNIAYASFEVSDLSGGQLLRTTQSNAVNIEIAKFYGLELFPDQLQQVEAGSKVIWLNQVTNTSNTNAWFDFKTAAINHLSNLKIYLDANQDGVLDISDTLIKDGLELQPNQTVHLWVVADTSLQTPDQSNLELPLTAQIREEPQQQKTVQDPVQVFEAKLKIEKAVDQQLLSISQQAQTLNYTLTVTNSASLPVSPATVTVDGQEQSWVIVEDPLPANTVFEDIQVSDLASNTLVLHKLAEGQYSSHLPQDKSQIGHAVVAYKKPFASGQKSEIKLKVKTQPTISYTTLVNGAYVLHQKGQVNQKTLSNKVETKVVGQPTLDSTTNDFKISLYTGKVNEPIYLKTNAAVCNANRFSKEQARIRIQSKLTGDIVIISAMESGENTGLFQFSLDTEENAEKNLNDAVLQTLKRDEVTASLVECVDEQGQVTTPINDISTQILIDPYGIIFDAKTKKPVAGATVILVDENDQPVGNNVAFEVDRTTGALRSIPAKQVTSATGEFVYPQVIPGNYKLLVDTSTIATHQYSFVSDQVVYPISSFNGMAVHSQYSYGGIFTLTSSSPALNIDIPIDPLLSQSGLMVQKTARDSSIELGDFTDYSITVSNKGDVLARDVKLQDSLPRGFSYVPNTMRIDGKPVADPEGGKGPYLTLGLGDLAVNASAKIEYRVLVGPNALNGDGINRARAVDGSGLSSNEAQAKVKVRPGAFSADAFVVGKVYTDCNRNGIQDKGELGVPGVRLYMEDGSYVITDREGKYDFYGVSAKTHVLKIDRTTLPAGVELLTQSNRNAGDPSSRFVDVKRGELHRADFAMANQADACSAPLMDAIKQRQEKINSSNLNLEKALNKQLSIDAPSYLESSTRSENTQGCLANDNDQNCLLNRGDFAAQKQPQLLIDPVKPPVLVNLEEYLKRSDNNALEILNLKEGQVLPHAQTTIQVQGAAGATQRVLVNDVVVADKQRGKLAILDEHRKQGVEYVGVALKVGKNSIRAEQLDFAGNVRESHHIQVIVPDEIHQLKLQQAPIPVMANGRDVMQLRVQLQDKQGIKVATRTSITLESDIGIIDLPDLNPNEPGIQSFIDGGEMIIPILAPNAPARGKLRVSSGLIKEEIDIQFQADLRPLIAVGLIEGSINFNNFDSTQLHSVNRNDGFENELNEIAEWGNDTSLTGRTAMFLKGKVRGDYLLTLAYDSNKSSKQRLFRDIQPDEYYPVYGDAAAKGFEAQSTSKLYVRLDKGRSYAMYGDYVTRTEKDEGLALGQYNRSLTGLKVGHEGDKFQASAFVAETKSRQVVTENRALGISGPYSLGSISSELILDNSEKVEILTRDRNNPGLIIAKQSLTRFSDYEVDTYSNSIYLKQAVASVDQDLNPNFIRITVEADEIGEEYQVGGMSFSYAMKSHLKMGGSFVQSSDPLNQEQIASLNTVVKVGQYSKFIAEVAQSKNTDSTADQITQINSDSNRDKDQGTAARVEFEYAPSFAHVRAYHQQAEEGFQNDAATISAGRKESGIKASAPIAKLGLARIEAIRTEDQENKGVRTGLSTSLERNFFRILAVELGLRHYDETSAAATLATENLGPYNGTTGRIKFTGNLPWKGASTFIEYEQDLSNSDKQVLSVGGTAKVLPNTEIYARHELISAIDGLYSMNSTEETNSTVFGISSNYMKDGSAFSEYRVADGISNREAEAALGLRNRWQLKPRVYVSSSFERIQSLSKNEDNTSNDATALSLGLEYLVHENWKATTRLEGRRSDTSDTLINTLGYAYKLSDDATVLTKNTLNFVDNKAVDQGDHLRNRFQLGYAWRDYDQNKLDILSKIEYYYENNATDLEAEFKREAYVTSIHTNYHPQRRLTLSGQYAAKWSELDEDHITSNALTQLFSGRVIYDINERWDMSVQAGTLWANRGAGTRYLVGAELGYLLATNLWVSTGYNFMGYQDDELSNTSSTGEGAYLRFRFKFDEDLFGRRSANTNFALEPEQGR
ncbi:SdrD B-like domain-containing protein [Acinetobacter variabilis]|uniref:SdrD B-like domain-containing protein n=1 Tax=Acinetobacter variabilis TaxID=70346 RepID=UPI0028ABD182|nr:SdrD B-like domain-containing protein [Acinetobacter variabilis]